MRVVAAVVGLLAAAALAPAGEPERVAGLVPRLGHADFAEREAAGDALAAAGDAALPALRLAVAAGDAEVARRAAALVERLTRESAARKLLAPTRVTAGSTTLGPLTDGWRKGTGVGFVLEPVGLADVAMPTKPADPVPLREAVAAVAAELKLDVTVRESSAGAAVVLSPRAEGAAAVPSFTGHAVAVLAPPPAAGVVLPAGSLSVVLQALPEPRVRLRRLTAVVVFKAVDGTGRDLATLPALVKPPPPPPAFRSGRFRGGRVVVEGDRVTLIPDAPRTTFAPTTTQALLRFVPPAGGPSARRKRVEGVLRATVAGPAEELAAVTGLDRKPRAATTDRGVRLGVTTVVEQPGDGTFMLVVTVVSPPHAVTFGEEPPPADATPPEVYGRGLSAAFSAAAGLTVTDAAGEPFDASGTSASVRPLPDGLVSEQLMVRVRPTDKTSGGPATVTLRGSHCRPLDIPFTLTDVPLHAGPATP